MLVPLLRYIFLSLNCSEIIVNIYILSYLIDFFHHALILIALCRFQMAHTPRTAATIDGNGDVGPSTLSSTRGAATPSTQQTVQGIKRKNSGGKSPGPEWQFATNVSKFIEWKCNFCGVSKSGGAPRIREHLLGGNG